MVILIKNSVTPYIATGLTEAGLKDRWFGMKSMPKALVGLKSLTLSGDLVLMQTTGPISINRVVGFNGNNRLK